MCVIPYTYPISGWRDKLVSYNGESFVYDNLGNPTTYRNKTLVWSHGRQLDRFGNIAEYKYNANGIRTTKISNGFTTSYYLNGNKIVRQQDNLNTLDFYYGASGISGFHITSSNAIYNGTTLNHDFYYKKSLQGDIIGIVDSDGIEIVKYVYDAWGNHKAYDSKTGILLDISSYDSYTNTGNIVQFIASKNPFRYRGYYYDYETGLYYLNSRYYDPEVGRFINADDINILYYNNNMLNGLNLYNYCYSNPCNFIDKTGRLPSYVLNFIYGLIRNQQKINIVTRKSYSESIISDPILSALIGNFTLTVSTQDQKTGLIYAFSDNDAQTSGFGLNFGDIVGFELGITRGSFWDRNIAFSMNLGSISISTSIGTSGISLGFGYTNGNTSISINGTIGWGTLAFATILYFIPGGKLFAALLLFFNWIFAL